MDAYTLLAAREAGRPDGRGHRAPATGDRMKSTTDSYGYTRVEMLVSITMLSVVLGAAVSLVLGVQRNVNQQEEWARAEQSLRAVQSVLSTTLRAVDSDPHQTGATQLDPDPDGDGTFDDIRVVSDFNPADGDMNDAMEDIRVWLANDSLWARWQGGGTPQVMAYPVDELAFEYYANDGTQLTTVAQVAGATRVQFLLAAPRGETAIRREELESWVYLRNRR